MPAMSFFSNRYMLAVHIVQIVLVVAAMGLSVPRLFMKNQPRTRANTIALGMGAKSLVIITYQILSEHARYFQRWYSLKANIILNFLENVFWGAVAVLIIQANLKRCTGVGCTLSWVIVPLAIILTIFALWTAVVSYLDFRLSRGKGDFGRSRSNTQLEKLESAPTQEVCVKTSGSEAV